MAGCLRRGSSTTESLCAQLKDERSSVRDQSTRLKRSSPTNDKKHVMDAWKKSDSLIRHHADGVDGAFQQLFSAVDLFLKRAKY